MENKEKVLMKKYEMGRLLGQGNFAKVYHGRNIETGQSVAVKVIQKDKVSKVGMIDQTKREISAMSLVKHPNILELYEVMATKTKIYFVMEYAKGGELLQKVLKGKLREDVSRKYFQQLISAVDFCHTQGVYHRDLKLENLLIDENGALKVSDFGLSALAESKHQDMLLHTTCGTPAYVAPEVIHRKGYDGAKADVWSCGVVLYALLAGSLPFNDSNLMAMYRKISTADYKVPNWFPPEVTKLLLRIFNPNPKERISIARIMATPWFRKGFNPKPDERRPKTELANYNAFEAKKLTNLNAFDIISLSSGLDLSGLFYENDQKKKEMQFTSTHTASAIISKLEDIAESLKLKVKMKDGGLMKMEGSNRGRKGALAIDVKIFEFTPSFHLVEIKKSSGDTLEFQNTLQQDVKPALKDIVCAWQGKEEEEARKLYTKKTDNEIHEFKSKAQPGSRIQVSPAGNNIFIFSFSNESAREWVLEHGPWHVHNKPLILRKWEPNLKSLSFNLSKIPVWVQLYNVPLELFSRAGLSYIASAIGVPISMDSITAAKSRLEFAKVCVEIGVKDTIPKHINIVLKDGQTTSISVEVPWLPQSCRRCNVFGHNEK
ncbi:CBL-interacting protein kinase 2-like [Hibiscus syriacus]|uniref:CBL-interacting protein kinase 2-like n=1 Tax=Hibiscus syriacus TaxID=106335 RepID=UPI00192273B8|nr:CBL-interacting protein kinase 2-like [Hibiscus syriacus]